MMNPKRFLSIASVVLITLGVLGLVGILGSISPASFFHPPYWINWVHLGLGICVSFVVLKGDDRLQAWVVVFPMILGTMLGVVGLLFGPYLATRYAIPELADPSDHLAHLIVGLTATWAWFGRAKRA